MIDAIAPVKDMEYCFTPGGASFRLTNEIGELITGSLDRFAEGREKITAEISLEYQDSGGYPHRFTTTRYDLTSASSRQKLSSQLQNLSATELLHEYSFDGWNSFIDYLSEETVKRLRKGEPIVELDSLVTRSDSNRFRLEPIIMEGEASTIYADGGEGKSLLATYFAALIQHNIADMGLVPLQANVLVCDYETSPEEYAERYHAFKKGISEKHGIELEGSLYYRFCSQPLLHEIEQIQKEIADKDIELIIIDSQVAALGDEPESAKAVNQYFNALRTLKITSLTIDHKPKEGNSIFGSVFKKNRSRSVFELKREKEANNDNELRVALYHRKSNNSRLLPPMGFKFTFHRNEAEALERIIVDDFNISIVPELASALPLKERIRTLLIQQGKMPVNEIAEYLGENQNAIRARLNENKKLFRNFIDGWGVLSDEKK